MVFMNLLPFLLLLTIPLIIFLALTGKRRYTMETTTLFLWNIVLSRKKSSVTFHRFIKIINLILQILIIISLVCAMADPRVKRNMNIIEQNVILIIDISASMNAPYGQHTRLYGAKRRAYEIASRLDPRYAMAVVRAGAYPRLSVPFTKDREKIKREIMETRATGEAGDMQKALDMAVSFLRDKAHEKIIVISDGAYTLSNPYPDILIRYIPAYDTEKLPSNIAITEFQFREKTTGSRTFEVLAQIKNYNADKERAAFRVQALPVEETLSSKAVTGKGNPVFTAEYVLDPFEERAIVFSPTLPGETILEAKIDAADDLDTDNSAWAVIPGKKSMTIFLVTGGNFFLESALRSITGITLRKTEKITYNELNAAAGEYDIIIFDRITPPGLVNGAYILIQSFPPGIPLEPGKEIPAGPVIRVEREHPVMKSLTMENTQIQKTTEVSPGKDARVLFRTKNAPCAVAYNSDKLRAVCFFFDLLKSNIVLKASFPLLIKNSLEWLAGEERNPGLQITHTGDIYKTTINPWIESLSVTGPGGKERIYREIHSPFQYDTTEQPGVYTITGEGMRKSFAVNLTDREESDIRNRLGQSLGTDGDAGPAGEIREEIKPVGHYFIIICILLLIAEWIVWKRTQE